MSLKHHLLVIGSLFAVLKYELVPQYTQGFYCKDPIISHKFSGDTISLATLLYVSFLGPLVLTVLLEVLRQNSLRQVSVRTVWHIYAEYLAVMWIVLLTTEVGKRIFREHRPHFLHSCAPDTSVDCEHGVFIPEFKCTSSEFSDRFKDDSSKSFPSGHSSASVLTSMFSVVLVCWRFPQGKHGPWKLCLIIICLAWGVICPLSRIYDRRHHWWDVLFGAVLGAFGAWYALLLVRKKLVSSADQKGAS